jgi:hypothetical protein
MLVRESLLNEEKSKLSLKDILKFPDVPQLKYVGSSFDRNRGSYSTYTLGDLEIEASYDKWGDYLTIGAWNPIEERGYKTRSFKNVSKNLEDVKDEIRVYLDTIEDYEIK